MKRSTSKIKQTNKLIKKEWEESVLNDTCVFCYQPAVKFRDEKSRKEFIVSGMCETCQDEIFGKKRKYM